MNQNHDVFYVMMMDALDGELPEESQLVLEVHLRACPECAREWRALLAIDTLFRQTPALSPAAGFTQRTLARLPDRRYRIWLIGAIYVALLVSGVLPLIVGVWAVSRYGTVVTQPAMLTGLVESLRHLAQVAGAIVGALFTGIGEFAVQQPAVIGWLLVMVGIVSLWTGVYRQLIHGPGLNLVRVPTES
ncbi:MAG: zf-HC2 domain-containing protein [Anaerolineales bacterium]|nr:zf-HC2 domain-containing protein [Anaerolineales bacterium]